MPALTDEVPFRENSKQIGVNKSLLYNGSRFKGFQKSKGNSYEVEVILQVSEASDIHEMSCTIPAIINFFYRRG